MEEIVLQIDLTGELPDSLTGEVIWTPLGARGVGIKHIDLVARDGLVDTYRITYDDGHLDYFYITNGARGERGPQGIAGPPGIQGVQGIQGIQGQHGEQGIPGIEGRRGPVGPQGIQGERGEAFRYENFTQEQLETLRGPEGPRGLPGERGFSGVAVETKGFVAFNITEDGVLQCSYTGEEAPDYYIDQNGHLILEV